MNYAIIGLAIGAAFALGAKYGKTVQAKAIAEGLQLKASVDQFWANAVAEIQNSENKFFANIKKHL